MSASTLPRQKPRRKRLGSRVPRVFTPPLQPLEPRSAATEARTLGYDVIDFARDVLGIVLHPWQEWLLIHMLELNEDGSLRFRYAVVLVARQNGKSTISKILALWFMVVWGWPLVLGTAQDLDVAEEIWQGVVDWVEDEENYPDLAALLQRVVKVNGKKSLELTSGARYKVKAANRKAGRGLSGNLVLLDELREHHSFAAWGAITKTTMARAEALILCLSNAGDEASVVLRHLRMLAHAAIGDPDGINAAAGQSSEGLTEFDLDEVAEALEEDLEDLDPEDLDADPDMLFLAEWSSTPGCDPRDRDEWCWSNPALGHPNGITERAIVGALKADDLRTFREENLCQWNDGVADGPFPPGSWEQGQNVPEETPDGALRVAAADELQGPLVACVDMSVQRAHAWIAVGGYRADGLPQVEIVAKRAGDDWVREWLLTTGVERGVTAVTGQAKGAPISPLIATLEAEVAFPIDVVPLAGSDLLEAFAWTFDAVRDGKVRHNRQGPLDRAAGTAKTNTLSQGAKLLDRRHADIDVAPLQAFIGAYWLLARRPAKPAAPAPQLPLAVRESWDDVPGQTLTGDLNDIEF
ncbi:terminase [Serinibacter salmoneus]|uniref:Phage terminase large subunit-like protein n=1 Tax=Serinibacter salmoneus TaxID=556530 RepID=A0A2A9CZL8_9MICO|nr:terminase [Serinibacter salmoneus]PFG19864.1 phage terminase large subunit-like protein [Serinibacter salmoneus]